MIVTIAVGILVAGITIVVVWVEYVHCREKRELEELLEK